MKLKPGDLPGLRETDKRKQVIAWVRKNGFPRGPEQVPDAVTVDLYLGVLLGVLEPITQSEFAREATWTESLAIGSEKFVKRMQTTIRNRSRIETVEAGERTDSDPEWVLRQTPPANAYGRFSGPKVGSDAT